ncbi:hypothetical protein AVEN_66512-1 [Araneus ventricosus]|uniref:Uncharacterized protein n=1 Tax=Araneus ventricosus TaxID=182803 RepID=A0A4Y2EB20_ARAVE|nr:hypothetical protein AVEN_66512-1 [Araneus ventricosus]
MKFKAIVKICKCAYEIFNKRIVEILDVLMYEGIQVKFFRQYNLPDKNVFETLSRLGKQEEDTQQAKLIAGRSHTACGNRREKVTGSQEAFSVQIPSFVMLSPSQQKGETSEI